MNTKFYVCDATPGSGKTFAAINLMKVEYSKDNEHKWLYITPYLTEIERIKGCCPEMEFKTPEVNENSECKYDDLIQLLKDEENIVTTHALFDRFNKEIRGIIQNSDYSLIMDEVHQCNERYYDKKNNHAFEGNDLNILFESGWCEIDENNLLVWNKDDYEGATYGDLMTKAKAGKIICYLKDETDKDKAIKDRYYLIENGLPISIFQAFKEVYVLTYMFEAQMQKYYYNYWGIQGKYLHVEGDSPINFSFVDGYQPPMNDGIKYRDLIHIVDDQQKINNIGRNCYVLSSTSYHEGRFDQERLRKDWNNCCKNRFYGATTSNVLCTTFIGYEENLLNNVCKNFDRTTHEGRIKTNWIAYNARATNMYRNRNNLGYFVNIFTDPTVSRFYEKNNIKINENMFALSELIQWLYRSAIRDDNPVNLYIPSKRMRTILETWISGHNGVRWSDSAKKWQAYLDTYFIESGEYIEERVYLGNFDCLNDAINCRKNGEVELCRENSRVHLDNRYLLLSDFE